MMEVLPSILVLLFILLVLPPLVVWGLVGEDESPHFDVYDPSQHVVPHEVTTFLLQNVAALTAEGFTHVADLYRQHGQLTTRIAFLQHAEGATATVAVVASQQGTANAMVEFTAELSGGRIFDVNNVSTAPISSRRGPSMSRTDSHRSAIRIGCTESFARCCDAGLGPARCSHVTSPIPRASWHSPTTSSIAGRSKPATNASTHRPGGSGPRSKARF